MSVKIAMPWPARKSSQSRIRESLDLWESKDCLRLCLVEPSQDEFVSKFDTFLLKRNSLDIGTKVPKPYILDMVECILDSNADWYGFGNSDIVAVGDMIDKKSNHEVLIYHRVEINEWSQRLPLHELDDDVIAEIEFLYEKGLDHHEIQRILNRNDVPPPKGFSEWDYMRVKECLPKNREIFFWGQDMFLFRADVVEKVIDNYLRVKDPILCTGGFDPRLSKWLMDNFDSSRVLNKVFHKRHQSEWNLNEPEYRHNGGDILMKDRYEFYDHKYLKSMRDNGYKGFVPKYLEYLIKKNNPEMYDELFSS
jgi:hypothetical protein